MTRVEDKGKKLEPTLSRADSRKDPCGPVKNKRRKISHKKIIPKSQKNINHLRNWLGQIANSLEISFKANIIKFSWEVLY